MGVHPDDIVRIEWDIPYGGKPAMTLWLESAPKSWHSFEGVRVLGMSGMSHSLVVKPEIGNGVHLRATPNPPREQS